MDRPKRVHLLEYNLKLGYKSNLNLNANITNVSNTKIVPIIYYVIANYDIFLSMAWILRQIREKTWTIWT